MKRLAVAIILLFCAGCMPNRAFVSAVDMHTAVILPEYRAYVAADATLDETSIRIRLESADALRALIDAGQAGMP